MKEDACEVCGWYPPVQYVELMIRAGQYAAKLLGKRFLGVVLPCAECLPPRVIQRTYGLTAQ